RIVELIEILKREFEKLGEILSDQKADELTKRFIDEVFRPEIMKFCLANDLDPDDCKIKEDWNQAAFAAFMTYEKEQDFLGELQEQLKLDLKAMLEWLRKESKEFKSQKKIDSFTEYLK